MQVIFVVQLTMEDLAVNFLGCWLKRLQNTTSMEHLDASFTNNVVALQVSYQNKFFSNNDLRTI